MNHSRSTAIRVVVYYDFTTTHTGLLWLCFRSYKAVYCSIWFMVCVDYQYILCTRSSLGCLQKDECFKIFCYFSIGNLITMTTAYEFGLPSTLQQSKWMNDLLRILIHCTISTKLSQFLKLSYSMHLLPRMNNIECHAWFDMNAASPVARNSDQVIEH